VLSCVQNKLKYFLHSFRSTYKEDKKRKETQQNDKNMENTNRSEGLKDACPASKSKSVQNLVATGRVCIRVLQKRVCSLLHRVICKRVEKQDSNKKEYKLRLSIRREKGKVQKCRVGKLELAI